LAERVEVLEKGDQARTVIKAALKSKKKASAAKKRRRKYRKLEDAKKAMAAGATDAVPVDADIDEDDEDEDEDENEDDDGDEPDVVVRDKGVDDMPQQSQPKV